MATISASVLNTEEEVPISPINGLAKEGFIRLNTHDISFAEGHISTIERFTEDLQEAVNAVWPSRSKKSRYTEVYVILMSWEDDTLGVEREIKRLSQVFSNIYRFEVNEFKIPRKLPGLATTSQLTSFLLKAGQDCLLIVYYAGHTRLSQQTNEPPIWTATEKPDSPTLPSGGVQQLVEESELDVLLLYDSCHSSHPAVSVSGQGVTEVIAACGFETQAPIVGPHSFTNALIRVLEESFVTAPFSVADLHSRVIGNLKNWKPALLRDSNGEVWRDEYDRPKYECHKRRTPVHCFLTNETPCRSIMLAPLTSIPVVEPATSSNSSTTNLGSDENSVATTSTAPTEAGEPTETTKSLEILLAIRLEEDYFLDGDDDKKVRAWCEWVRNVPEAANTVKIQGVYRSCSTLVLLSMPTVVWDLLPDKAGYSFVGFVASGNLAAGILGDNKPEITEGVTAALPAGIQVGAPQLSIDEGQFPLESNRSIQRIASSASDKKGRDLVSPMPYNAGSNNGESMVNTPIHPTSNTAGHSKEEDMVAKATAMKLAALSTVSNRFDSEDVRRYHRTTSNDVAPSFNTASNDTQADLVAEVAAMRLATWSVVNDCLALDDLRKLRRASSNDDSEKSFSLGRPPNVPGASVPMINARGQVLSREKGLAMHNKQNPSFDGRTSHLDGHIHPQYEPPSPPSYEYPHLDYSESSAPSTTGQGHQTPTKGPLIYEGGEFQKWKPDSAAGSDASLGPSSLEPLRRYKFAENVHRFGISTAYDEKSYANVQQVADSDTLRKENMEKRRFNSEVARNSGQNNVSGEGGIDEEDKHIVVGRQHSFHPSSSDSKYTPPALPIPAGQAKERLQNKPENIQIPGVLPPQAALPDRVVVTFGSKCFKTSSGPPVGSDFDGGRELVIVNQDGSLRFKHRIKLASNESCYPYTRIQFGNPHGMEVEFRGAAPEVHAIFINEKRTSDAVPKYIFKQRQDFIDFQSEVRGKKLEDSFDTRRISSKKFPSLEALDQHLKIWRDHVTGDCSISFYADFAAKQRDIEFPLRIFEQELQHKGDGEVCMNFLAAESKSVRRYSSNFRRRTSENPSSSSHITIPREPILSDTSSISSMWTGTTATSRSSILSIESETAIESLANEMSYLRVTFPNIAEARRFRQTYERIYFYEVSQHLEFVSDWQKTTFTDSGDNVQP